MKLVTFASKLRAPTLGLLEESRGEILDVQASHVAMDGQPATAFASMQQLIEGGAEALAAVRLLGERADAVRLPVAGTKLLAPLPKPEQIRDCLGFKQHVMQSIEGRLRDAGVTEMTPTQKLRVQLYDKRPHWYKCNRMAVSGPEDEIVWPTYSSQRDYELEMAMVIGRPSRNVRAENFSDYVFGYTIFNDFSARDVQNDEMAMLGANKSKDFDTGNAFGPCIATADEFDPSDVAMTTRINGEFQNSNRSSTMNWTFGDLLQAISDCETVYPGEIICSGTVGGGSGLESGRYLEPGDVIELEIEGIGILRNSIAGA